MTSNSYSDATNREFREQAKRMTQLLRIGQDGRWRNLRDQLAKIGVDVEDAALANLGPDDYKMEAGLIVTRGSRCFLFTLDWSTTEAGETEGNYEDAWLSHWTEVDRTDLKGYEAATAVAADTVLTSDTGMD
jgi:hypothetical protein